MEQFRKVGEVIGSLKALMVFQDEIQVNRRQCCLLVDAFGLAFDSIAEELRTHFCFAEKTAAKWRALELPLKELHRVFCDGEQYVRQCLEPGDWWSKAISHHRNTDCVELHLHNLLWCVPVVLEAIENAAESADHDELHKKRLVFSKKYEREWMDPKLFQQKLGKSYVTSQDFCNRLDSAWKEDSWILSETIAERRISTASPLTKQENKFAELLVDPRSQLFPSSVLLGSPDYQVRRRFGAGSNYKEVQWMGNSYVVKHVIGDVDTLMNCISVLSSVAHPNVMQYLYSFADEEKRECFMVMELMNKDLSSHIRETSSSRRKVPFPQLVAVDTMLQIARGMEYLHSKKIYHGDLNPFNVLVKARNSSSDGFLHVKITSFGLSPTKNSKAITNPCIWHSPEQQSGNALSLTDKADVYSFGMICFELLTGKVPFEDDHLQGDKMSKNIRAGERPLFPSQCPKYLANLTRRCWHSDPVQRPSFSSLCRVLRYIKRFLVLNPDQSLPEPPTPPVDYFDLESSLSKILSNWARRDDPRVWDVPFQMYAYRVLEREKTGANIKDRTSESGSEEGASICGDENVFNGILDDALSNSSDSVKSSLQTTTQDKEKKASPRTLNGKANKQSVRAKRQESYCHKHHLIKV
ncbi:RAF-like serine/threonine-protein kinase PRAF isoform X2 [Curcuma longa]|uniref:RAF-like serine/threonine-protein kinase PRAF isoform X2 n=1 Tax=Curcuma longa TaxID=136217 RepID=UPI003D9F5C20